MANNIGWISLHRQIQDHWIWQDANKLKWWLDMLMTVNSNPAKVNLGNEIYDCGRGESLISLQGWASRWHISKDAARNFITLLEKDKMIKRVSIGKSTRITICNYDTYQQPLHVKQTDDKRTANAKQTPSHPNNKEDKENNENKILSESLFDVIIKEEEHKPILFRNSLEFDINHLKKNLEEKYSMANIEYYYESALNWSNSKNKKMVDWTATVRNFILRDIKENKLKTNTIQTQKMTHELALQLLNDPTI
ncbi:MAG: hypothetical protein P4L31_07655 [Candidatus Babeliales bacterium]|nr:hypothetical protein [Candidatus Babeliales bacterium]